MSTLATSPQEILASSPLLAGGGWGRVTVRLRPGEAMVLMGGLIAHAIEPLGDGHLRITSPLCFHVA